MIIPHSIIASPESQKRDLGSQRRSGSHKGAPQSQRRAPESQTRVHALQKGVLNGTHGTVSRRNVFLLLLLLLACPHDSLCLPRARPDTPSCAWSFDPHVWTTETAQESNRWLIVSEKRRGRQSHGRRQPTVSLAEPRQKRTTRRFFALEAFCFELLSYCFFYSCCSSSSSSSCSCSNSVSNSVSPVSNSFHRFLTRF